MRNANIIYEGNKNIVRITRYALRDASIAGAEISTVKIDLPAQACLCYH